MAIKHLKSNNLQIVCRNIFLVFWIYLLRNVIWKYQLVFINHLLCFLTVMLLWRRQLRVSELCMEAHDWIPAMGRKNRRTAGSSRPGWATECHLSQITTATTKCISSSGNKLTWIPLGMQVLASLCRAQGLFFQALPSLTWNYLKRASEAQSRMDGDRENHGHMLKT